MSSEKNGSGKQRQPFTPRKGQEAVRKMISEQLPKGNNVFLAELPGGYGKSLAALLAYKQAKDDGYVDWCLYLAPGVVKISDWTDDLLADADRIGLRPVYPKKAESVCLVKGAFAVSERRQQNWEFFAATVQFALADERGSVNIFDALIDERCFVIIDECHHYTATNKSGQRIKDWNFGACLGLSATPDHRTEEPYFNSLPEGQRVHVSLQDAFDEQAIRAVHIEPFSFFIDIEQDSNVFRVRGSDLEEELRQKNISLTEYEAQIEMRYLRQYVSPMFVAAIESMQEKNDKDEKTYLMHNKDLPSRKVNQMLVFAASVRQAEYCVSVLNQITGHAGFADYIGTGPQGRPSKENERVLRAYKKGRLNCLVQVSMAGEGFNNPCSSIIIYLGLMSNGNKPIQDFFRAVRRNYMVNDFSDDYAIFFIPDDSKFLPKAKELARLLVPDFTKGDKPEAVDRLPFPINIKPFAQVAEVINAIIRGSTPKAFFGEERTKEIKEKLVDHVARPRIGPGFSNDERLSVVQEITQIVEDNFDELIEGRLNKEQKKWTRERLQDEVDKVVGKIAYSVARHQHTGQIDGRIIGVYKKAIHSQFVKMKGVRTSKMTYEILQKKYEWLEWLADSMNPTTGTAPNIPIWLMM